MLLRLPLNDGIEPEWSWISPKQARLEAVERLLHNHEAVARFAARAKSGPGFPPAWAELADPNAAGQVACEWRVEAQAAEKWVPIIDVCLG